MGKVL